MKPPSERRRLFARGRAEVLWGLGFIALAQLALTVTMQDWLPELRDPEYGRRLNSLEDRLEDEPGRPLVVALGSSRMAMGLRPELLPARTPGDGAPLVFNFALVGAGPVTQLLCLHRLLDDGIRPNGVLLEVWPPLLHPDFGLEVNRLDPRRLESRDLPILVRYGAEPNYLAKHWWRSRVTPAFEHRLNLMSQFLPGWLPYNYRQDIGYRGLNEWGFLPNKRSKQQYSDAEFRTVMEPFRKQYEPLVGHFKVSDTADRAMRELLALCRQQRLHVTVAVLPEGSLIRSWYTPDSWQRVEAYLTQLQQEYGIGVLNARAWVDDDGFRDGYHLHVDGAATFTRRLAQDRSLEGLGRKQK